MKRYFRLQRLPTSHVVLLGFAGLVFVGTLLLALPISARGEAVPVSTALFTATSAVSVTGLSLVDTGSRFSAFGQGVILVLIQLGGLGYMVGATLVALLIGREVGLRGRLLLGETFELSSLQERARLARAAVLTALAIEGIGALLLAVRSGFDANITPPEALQFGFFHSISAFCNAGFDMLGHHYTPGGSLIPFVGDPWVNGVIAALVICGSLGFVALWELGNWRRRRRFSLHTRLCLIATALLLTAGAGGVLLLEWTNPRTLGELYPGTRLQAALFQSVSARTAGFQTVPVGEMRSITLLWLALLMFIGACPGGTGGGVKVTTVAVILGSVWSTLRGRAEPERLGRRLAPDQLHRALAIVTLAVGVVFAALAVMVFTEPAGLQRARVTNNIFMSLVFEVTSALGTVGLSTGITPHLSGIGQGILIVVMFLGRVGPLTAAAVLAADHRPEGLRLAEERVLLG